MISTTFAQQGYHIRCNLIAPGLYPSEMTEGSMKSLEERTPDKDHDAFKGAHKMPADRCPAGKFIQQKSQGRT